VVGPYWWVMVFITTPLILVPSFFAFTQLSSVPFAARVVFACFAAFTVLALWKTGGSDPGLVPFRAEEPSGTATAHAPFAMDSMTQSWRPVSARWPFMA